MEHAQTNATFINMTAYNSSYGNSGVYLGNVAGNSNGAGNFVIGRRTGATSFAESMRINKSGNVGIGTRSPSTKLEIDGSTSDGKIKITLNSTTHLIMNHNEIYRTGGSLYLNYNAQQDIIMCGQGGNVGIGTTSPSYKLDVNGTGRFTGNLTAGGNRYNKRNHDNC